MSKAILASLMGSCLFAGIVSAEDVEPQIEGSVYTFNIESGDATYSSALPSTCTKVIKSGAGCLYMSGHSADFHGSVEIQEGVVVASDAYALGCGTAWTSPNTITVSDGAQLRAKFDGDKNGNSEGRGFRSRLRLSGTGPSNDGAFYYDYASPTCMPRWIAYEIALDADATMGGESAYSACCINLNGHALTYDNVSSDKFLFYYCKNVKGPDADGNPGSFSTAKQVQFYGSTWTGTADTTFNFTAEKLHLNSLNPLPFTLNWSPTASKGTFEVYSGGSNGTQNVFNGNINFSGTEFVVWPGKESNGNPRGVTFNGSVFVSGGCLNKGGVGRLFVNGPTNIADKTFQMSAGEMLFENNLTNECQYLQLQGTDPMLMRFKNSGPVVLSGDYSSLLRGRYMRSPYTSIARLEILGDTDVCCLSDSKIFCIGQGVLFDSSFGFERCAGKLIVGEGSKLRHNLSIGSSGRGAVYAHNATIFWNSQSSALPGFIGTGSSCSGYGYFGMRGGTTDIPHHLMMAVYHDDATGFYVQQGGATTLSNEFLSVSTRGHAHLYVGSGGTFTQTAGSGYLGYSDGSTSMAKTGGDGVITVDGEGSKFKQYWFVGMHRRTNFNGYVNVNDGATLECKQIHCRITDTWPTDSELYLSFNGGIWKTYDALHTMFDLNDVTHAPKFISQKGGMTIDTGSGKAQLNIVPIIRPTGKVIKSITLPDDSEFLAETYFGPARISISSTGSGVGATAFAPFDDENEKLAGTVKVTSPGYGYDASTTSVKVWSMESDKSWDCSFELEDAQDGGFTKLGTGELQMLVPNTYTGLTHVAAGKLSLACDAAIGDGQDFKIGTNGYLFAEYDLSMRNLGGSGTLNVYDGKTVTVTDAFMVDADMLSAGNKMSVIGNGTFTFADGAKVRPYDASKFVYASGVILSASKINGTPELEGFPDTYVMKKSSDGKVLRLSVKKGTALLLR